MRIATAFAILMGMIVLAGSVVATRAERRRDIVLLRLVGATRGAGRAQPVDRVRLAVGGGRAGRARRGQRSPPGRWSRRRFEFAFRPDVATLALIPLGAIVLAVLAAFVAAQPALNARPAEGLRAL